MIRQESSALTVLAFLNVLMAGMGLLVSIAIGAMHLIELSTSTFTPLAMGGLLHTADLADYLDRHVSARMAIAIAFTGLSFVGYTLLLLAGIGLFHRRRWAWYLTLTFVILNVLNTIAYIVYEFGVIIPAIDAYARTAMMGNVQPFATVWLMNLSHHHMVHVVLFCIPVLYPVVALCLLLLPSVKQILDTGVEPPPGARDVLERQRPRYDYDEDDYDEDDDYPRRRRYSRWD
jgi:hypothetical protein